MFCRNLLFSDTQGFCSRVPRVQHVPQNQPDANRMFRAICLQTSKNVIRFMHFTLSYVITSKCTSFRRQESQSSKYRNIDCQVLSSFRSGSILTWGSQRCINSRIIAYQKDKLSALASGQQQVSILLNEGIHSPCFSVIQRSRY